MNDMFSLQSKVAYLKSFFCVLAGCMVFHLFWCDPVRSGCGIGRGSDLRIVCSRSDPLQVKIKLFFIDLPCSLSSL